jgi:hypothetical protein
VKSANLVSALLESDPVDPKEEAAEVPSAISIACEEAMAEFMRRCAEGTIHDARDADEQCSDIAQEACERHSLDPDDFDQVVSDLFQKASEIFPGQW